MLIHIAIISFTCLFRKIHAFTKIDDVSYGLRSTQYKFFVDTITQRTVKHSLGLPSSELPTFNRINNNRTHNFRIKGKTCVDLQLESNSNHEYNSNHINNGDTVIEDDVVRDQYSWFPYPAVTEDHFFREQQYYNNEQNQNNRPYTIVPSIVLENLNHFLFKGDNDFT